MASWKKNKEEAEEQEEAVEEMVARRQKEPLGSA